jgi:hypothetical protein
MVPTQTFGNDFNSELTAANHAGRISHYAFFFARSLALECLSGDHG